MSRERKRRHQCVQSLNGFVCVKRKRIKKGITKSMNDFVKKKREGINNYVQSLNGFVCVNIKIESFFFTASK